MEITEVTITPRDEDKLKAFVNVTFDNCFVVRGMKIIKGPDAFFVSMPSRRLGNGEHRDIAHPINASFRDKLENQILDEYKRMTGGKGN